MISVLRSMNTLRSSGLGVFTHVKTFVFAHKIISLIVLIAIGGGGYWAYTRYANDDGETRYVLGTVEKGTIVASISASGQVSASSQIDLTAKAAGNLVSLNVKVGQTVQAGALLGQIDATDAAYDLETAQLSYEELVTVDPDELRAAEDALEEAQLALVDSYVDARATLAVAATDMDNVITGLDDLYATNGYLDGNRSGLNRSKRDAIEKARDQWFASNTALDKFASVYRTVSGDTDDATITSVLSNANATAQAIAEAAKFAKDAVVLLREDESPRTTAGNDAYTDVTELVSTANAILSDTLSTVTAVTNNKRTLKNAEDDLADLKSGPDTLDVRAEQLSLRQKQKAYEDHSIRAPFDGVIASVPVRRGEALNSGATIATLITKQKIAELSLNEVDAAKIAVGDKATLTFDAIDGLTLTGAVAEIDLVGTVSQGVVSYSVKIGFDSEDERVKAGMTVNAAIQTDAKQDVLIVPSSAVKTQNGISYVQVFNPALSQTGGTQGVVSDAAPQQIEVETGISDDANVEILSGIEEGQQIVTRTISGTATANTTTTRGNSTNRGGGLGGSPGVIRF